MTKKTTDSVSKTDLVAIKELIKSINKEKGEGSIMTLDGTTSMPNVETMSTGSIKLNEILGGGYPKGRIIEIYGPESSGKTTLALMAVAEAQKQGQICAYIDVEQSLDPTWAKKIGVNLTSESLLFSQPSSGEDAGDIITKLIESGLVKLVVLDSVAAMTPQAELDGDLGDQAMGLQARLMSKLIRRINAAANQQKCTVIMVNQLREKIGIMFGNPEVTPGGKALKFYSSIRLDVRKKELIKEGSEVLGHKLTIKSVKNKIAPPQKTTDINLIYSFGFDSVGETISLAVEKNIIEKSGAWYSYNGEKIGQGEAAVKAFLLSSPDILKEVKDKILTAIKEDKEKKEPY